MLEDLCDMKEVPHFLHYMDSDVLTGCIKAFLVNLRVRYIYIFYPGIR